MGKLRLSRQDFAHLLREVRGFGPTRPATRPVSRPVVSTLIAKPKEAAVPPPEIGRLQKFKEQVAALPDIKLLTSPPDFNKWYRQREEVKARKLANEFQKKMQTERWAKKLSAEQKTLLFEATKTLVGSAAPEQLEAAFRQLKRFVGSVSSKAGVLPAERMTVEKVVDKILEHKQKALAEKKPRVPLAERLERAEERIRAPVEALKERRQLKRIEITRAERRAASEERIRGWKQARITSNLAEAKAAVLEKTAEYKHAPEAEKKQAWAQVEKARREEARLWHELEKVRLEPTPAEKPTLRYKLAKAFPRPARRIEAYGRRVVQKIKAPAPAPKPAPRPAWLPLPQKLAKTFPEAAPSARGVRGFLRRVWRAVRAPASPEELAARERARELKEQAKALKRVAKEARKEIRREEKREEKARRREETREERARRAEARRAEALARAATARPGAKGIPIGIGGPEYSGLIFKFIIIMIVLAAIIGVISGVFR